MASYSINQPIIIDNILEKEIMSGSTWSIWDFHLHSPHSILNNQFGNPRNKETWNVYVKSIEKTAKEYGVEAIGITDYFTIDGYKKLIEDYQENLVSSQKIRVAKL